LAIHLGSEDRVCTTQAGKGSRLVGKVYNLCRVLKLVYQPSSLLRAALGSSLIRRTLDTFVLMINYDVKNLIFGISSFEEVLLGNDWVYY
jgi:hypothetical protein